MSLVLLGFRFLLGQKHESRFFEKLFWEKSDVEGVSPSSPRWRFGLVKQERASLERLDFYSYSKVEVHNDLEF